MVSLVRRLGQAAAVRRAAYVKNFPKKDNEKISYRGGGGGAACRSISCRTGADTNTNIPHHHPSHLRAVYTRIRLV